MTHFLRHLGIFYMPHFCDMWQTTLLPKEGMLRNFSPEKSDGFGRIEPAILGTRGQHANH
jgi:hypothetical protein